MDRLRERSSNSTPRCSVLPEISTRGFREVGIYDLIESGFRKGFPDSFFDALHLFGTQQPACHTAANAIQKLQPIFQRRLFKWLPLFKPPAANVEIPAIADVVSIDFQAFAFGGTA